MILDHQENKGQPDFNYLLKIRATAHFYSRNYHDSELDFLNILEYMKYRPIYYNKV